LQRDSPINSPLHGRRIELAYVHGTESLVTRMVDAVKNDLIDRGALIIEHQLMSARGREPVAATNPDADVLIVVHPNTTRPLRCDDQQVMLVLNTGAATAVENTHRYDIVTADQHQGARLAAQHLRKIKCRHVCFLGVRPSDAGSVQPSPFDATSEARLAGFIASWGVDNVTSISASSYRYTAGAKAVSDYLNLPSRPDAVFAASDELALGFFFGAIGAGLRAGHDFQLVGFDGQSLGQTMPERPLTTVSVPSEEMGRRGVDLLASRLAAPNQPIRNLALGCEFIPGNTAVSR
jgi:DNA-binding LacI/PurR family transcriptional regulator